MKYYQEFIILFSEATITVIENVPKKKITGENNQKIGPTGDLNAKLYYESNRDTSGRRYSNGFCRLLPLNFFLLIIFAPLLHLVKSCLLCF